MRDTDMKKSITVLIVITLALASSVIFGLTGRYSAGATATTATQSLTFPATNLYALTTDNTIYVLTPGSTSFSRVDRIGPSQVNNENLIGIDFRNKDGGLYTVGDKGGVYLITNFPSTTLGATRISTMSTQFNGGFQSLMDFNPVVDAIRLIGSNDQNFAVVNANGGNLNVTAAQTAIAYVAGDPAAGADPEVVGGGYTNAFVGATNTQLYMIDHARDTLLTIAGPLTATGSSNTGGGQAKTIGAVLDGGGRPINFSPAADLDILYDGKGNNTIIGITGRTLFAIPVNNAWQNLAVGQTQNVTAQTVLMPAFSPSADAFIDIAAQPLGIVVTPSPTPTPGPTTYQAENATLGGGATVMTNHLGFTGTGFVDYADGVAGSFVEFTINQTGTRSFTFRYSNGSGLVRTVAITINGILVTALNFGVTTNFDTWTTISLPLNLGTTSGAKVRLTATTNLGGPNLDKVDVQ